MTAAFLGSKPLTVPPVKVTNASISQLYSDQVTSTSQRSSDEEIRASSTCLCALAVDKRDRISIRLLLHCKGGRRRSAEVYEIYGLKNFNLKYLPMIAWCPLGVWKYSLLIAGFMPLLMVLTARLQCWLLSGTKKEF